MEADLGRPEHQHAVLKLTDAYARDPMGNGKPLSEKVRRDLIPGLQQHPTTVIFLAYRGWFFTGGIRRSRRRRSFSIKTNLVMESINSDTAKIYVYGMLRF